MMASDRPEVIKNIKASVAAGNFHSKVEIDDPFLDRVQVHKTLLRFLKVHDSPAYAVRNFVARRMADLLTWVINFDTDIVGIEKISSIEGGAVVTSNHFSPQDNTVIRHLLNKTGRGHLYAVSQDTNFAMTGVRGFLMRNIDVIPISQDRGYMGSFFGELLKEALGDGRFVLIYPEQEMWFNYRKPRPLKRGAYYYAAKYGVPVVSCFVEIREKSKGLKYRLHVLDPIFPNSEKTAKENSFVMARQDYLQKVKAYEMAYGKELKYDFEDWDIAGYGIYAE